MEKESYLTIYPDKVKSIFDIICLLTVTSHVVDDASITNV